MRFGFQQQEAARSGKKQQANMLLWEVLVPQRRAAQKCAKPAINVPSLLYQTGPKESALQEDMTFDQFDSKGKTYGRLPTDTPP